MASAEGSHDMINRVMTKDNIGLAALLETKEKVWQNGGLTLGMWGGLEYGTVYPRR